ncbi:hypothetical protein AKUH4B114J_02670 [Apilactobacillus kunkeei]|uniref:hypothetical protein n=1 Tax=Apilactobacillus kunkeei TaxID=148814 RepID=UPI001C6F819A|nr:hypothetical protein [Apilactobacillus kunkeei]MBX8455145.1 hypothetical protein [Apilactobacillus kunkeei]QYU54680.1 hypothetical protein K2W87_01285 [Apilactobacillus kunkeei]CAI2565228.1 hypothetical protein AKUH4B405J_02570 [Apilactobacillus kunkeei]CAI2565412.1 hypothetical protein AKUH4B102A_02590 [Apilactobacillus kunkeei]CAI2565689.1 hypothetical protein AKUH3B101X_02660 [Apilactobacillus kunkeei]
MKKIRNLFLLLTIVAMLISLPSIDFGIKVSADANSSSNIIDDKDPEAIDGDASKPNEGTQKTGDKFNDNKTISDSINTDGIATTTSDNAYVDNNTKYHIIDTKLPKMTPTWGNYTHVRNMDVPSNYTSIDSINTGSTTFKTKWFLPEGFHVSPEEHGNYQGGIIANNSIYFVESAGTNTNKGAIVKIGLDALDKLGIDDSTQQNILAKVFNFFNRNSAYGSDHSKSLSDFIINTDVYRKDNSNIQTKIANMKKAIAAANLKVKTNQKAFNNATKQAKKKLAKTIKTNRKAVKKLKKKHVKTRAIKKQIVKLNKAYKKLNAKKKNLSKLAPKSFKTYNRVKKGQAKLITKDNKQINALNAKIDHNNHEIDRIGQRNDLFSKYFDLSKLLTISPVTNIGHGQTLSYNPSNNHVYLAQDDKLGVVGDDFYNQVTEMDAENMNPVHVYRFKLNNKGHYYAIHTLTFDNDGNAYFGVRGGPKKMKGTYTLFHGTMNESGIQFTPVKGLVKWPGSFNQGVTYNRNNNRLYLLSNDMIISIPVDEVKNDNIQPQDVHYTTFGTNREFESLSFDSSGYGYLVVLWRSEVLKSTTPID